MSKSKPAFTLFLSLVIPLFANLISPLSSFADTETEETLTITTYYPAPFGVYNEMRSKRMAVGDNYINGSTFSWDAGTIDANADLVVEGNVGIGTAAPSTGGAQNLKLDVEGAIGARYYCDENGNNCASAPLGGKTNIIQKVGDNDMNSAPSGFYAPLDDMDIDIVLSGNSALVHFSGVFWVPSGGSAYYRINRDNGQEYIYLGVQQQGGDTLPMVGQHLFSSLAPGSHNFKIEVRSDSGTFYNRVQSAPQSYRRVMQVTDLNVGS